MVRSGLIGAVLLAGFGAGPALADACAPILAAYQKQAAAPAVRIQMSKKGESEGEMVAIGETLYISAGGSWTKMKLRAGARQAMLGSLITEGSLSGCSDEGPVSEGGQALRVYGYTPPLVPLPGAPKKATPQKVWIGAADGLPYRMESPADGMVVTVTYDGVTAPIP